eukprot:6212151-Pleurochrysis_carterae.AAC.3
MAALRSRAIKFSCIADDPPTPPYMQRHAGGAGNTYLTSNNCIRQASYDCVVTRRVTANGARRRSAELKR